MGRFRGREGTEVEVIHKTSFQYKMEIIEEIIEPLYNIFRIVDVNRTHAIVLMYHPIERTKKTIQVHSPKDGKPFPNSIHIRWVFKMSDDLHVASNT